MTYTLFIVLMFMYKASTCSHGDVRLFGGYATFEGAPEVCIHGQWAYNCYQNWDNLDSTLFCRQILDQQNIRKLRNCGWVLMSMYLTGKF